MDNTSIKAIKSGVITLIAFVQSLWMHFTFIISIINKSIGKNTYFLSCLSLKFVLIYLLYLLH